jgi:hypothetical protein
MFMQSARYSCAVVIKPEISLQFFEKYSNNKNPSSGSQVIPCGQKDGRT